MATKDEMMLDYLLQMGAMQPQEEELKRKQAMVDMLRKGAMTPMEGQMIGKHYVAPGLAGALSQLGQAYFAGQAQQGVNQGLKGMNDRQKMILEELRRKRQGTQAPGYAGDYTAAGYDPAYGE